MDLNDLKVWLGDALADLSDDQLDRLRDESDRLDAAYPEDDEIEMWNAGMSAAVQYLLGQTTIDDVGQALGDARWRLALAMAAAKQVAAMAAAGRDLSEVEAARRAGIDRMTLLKVLGKR